MHKIALKTLTTATRDPREVKVKVKGRSRGSPVVCIEDPGAAACPLLQVGRVTREVKTKVTGRIKGDQVVGIVDLGAAASPVQKVGRVTKHPREKGDKWVLLARDAPRKPQGWRVRDLTMSSMAL